jgi:hypothetical protein
VPLFRRRTAEPGEIVFTVGVDNHRVIVGGTQRGCAMLEELDNYIPAVASRARGGVDGRDPVAVQSAKMDYAEMAEAAIAVVHAAVEELDQQGLLSATDVPAPPHLPALDRSLPTYEYIQQTYARAVRRIEWVRTVDRMLSERGIAITEPLREPA